MKLGFSFFRKKASNFVYYQNYFFFTMMLTWLYLEERDGQSR